MAVKLSKAARRALRRGRLKATATLTLRDAGGRTATGKAALKLKRAPVGRGSEATARLDSDFFAHSAYKAESSDPRRFVPLLYPAAVDVVPRT